MKVTRNGTLLLTFEPKNEKPEEKGRYDFSKRKSFRLLPKNIGQLLMLGKTEFAQGNNKELCIHFCFFPPLKIK